MSCIQLAEKICRAIRKHAGVEVHEVVLVGQLCQQLLERRFEEGGECEKMAALGYVHRAKLSRPFVYVLKDVPMNRLKMSNVESSRNRSLDQLRDAAMRPACFETFQLFRVSQTAQVFEDVCAGIEVRVRILGHRAHRSRFLFRLASTLH
jgi:hypothetical protein